MCGAAANGTARTAVALLKNVELDALAARELHGEVRGVAAENEEVPSPRGEDL